MYPTIRWSIKALFCVTWITFFSAGPLSSQILTIDCYSQNGRIGSQVTDHIINGSFENTNCPSWGFNSFCPNSVGYSCDLDDWICTGGGPSTYANVQNATFSPIPDGDLVIYFGNSIASLCPGPPNDSSCISDVGCTIVGIPVGYPINDSLWGGDVGVIVSQNVSGLIPGNIYVLEFWAGGESGYNYDGIFGVDVGYGNTFLRCKSTAPTDIGTRYVIRFKANSSNHNIRFTNWGHVTLYRTELALDDVRLYLDQELPQDTTSAATVHSDYQFFKIFYDSDQSILTVSLEQHFVGSSYEILNMSGQIVMVGSLNSPRSDLSAEGLSNGVYFLRIVGDNRTLYKFAKV